jgi:H+/gluconate symporter-like permease
VNGLVGLADDCAQTLGGRLTVPVLHCRGDVAMLVLAIGAASLFVSHVNDAGFWLVEEYLGASVPSPSSI